MLFHKDPCKHILVIRLSAMGDVAMCVPVIEALRRDYPALRITILTRPRFKAFFRDIKDIEFLTPDLDRRYSGLEGIYRLSREIAQTDIDTVVDLHDVLRTKVLRTLLWFYGKRVATIDKGRMDKRALTRKFRKIKKQLTTTIERYCNTFSHIGLKLGELLPSPRNPRPMSKELLAIAGPKHGVWIGVAPFAQHKGKVYPPILTDAMIGLLSERFGRVFIFGGGAHDETFAECMQERHNNVVSVAGRIELSEEMDLTSNLDCMVSMDSMAMHMASLVGTPVVSIWGATHPFAGFYGFGQNPQNAVQIDLACRPCSVYGNKPCSYKDYRCLNRIPPTTILERVTAVVNQSNALLQ